ncbi:type IV pilus modification PilV family protein [Endozoicomonas sp.]
MSRNNGFTMIEVLVAMIIISVGLRDSWPGRRIQKEYCRSTTAVHCLTTG